MLISEITYRLLIEADASSYRNLRLRSYQESPLAFSESYEDEARKEILAFSQELKTLGDPPEWFVLGSFSGDKLVGFVKFKRDQRSKARHKSMIHAMYVDPEERGKSIGSGLLKGLMQQISLLKGLEQIHLWVLHGDESASAFYTKQGFISQGPKVSKDIKVGEIYVDAEYMVKYLS